MLSDSSLNTAARYPPARRYVCTSRGILVLALIGVFGLFSFPCHAKKTDVVRLDTGNEITGEIKFLEKGLLTFDVVKHIE